FLAYARPAPVTRHRIDVAELLEALLVLLEHRPVPASIKVVRAYEGPLWGDLDADAIRQALWNLSLNAIEAMPDGGELVVSASASNGTLQISIGDSGHGIAPADLGHIFEPFYSTKPQGNGLGLALVHRIARDHGRDAEVRS